METESNFKVPAGNNPLEKVSDYVEYKGSNTECRLKVDRFFPCTVIPVVIADVVKTTCTLVYVISTGRVCDYTLITIKMTDLALAIV